MKKQNIDNGKECELSYRPPRNHNVADPQIILAKFPKIKDKALMRLLPQFGTAL